MSMNHDLIFEKQKNIKASVITGAITIILFTIFFYVQYNQPIVPEPSFGEGIEVNLGDAETGFGTIAPQAPSAPAEKATVQSNPSNNNSQVVTNTENPSEDDIDVNNKPTLTKKIVTTPVEKIVPVTKPKAVFSGSTAKGTAGNNADSYNGIRNQGIVGGKGDQGKPNGSPNSDSYTGNAARGNGGSGGVAIRNGLDGRRITRLPSFEDDFNENAKVAVDITVDQSGNVIAAIINPKGTTTTNGNIRSIALRKARSLKLNAGGVNDQTGTLVFNFKLRS